MNRFKDRLKAGDRQWGLWMSLASPVAADAVSRLGYDWLLCDTEHAPLEVTGALSVLQAADSRTEVIVRPAANDRTLIKRHLDQGAKTLLIPFVETADEAREAVRSCLYPPHGVRGVAGGMRASGFGTRPGYHLNAADETCVIVQVETGAALESLEEIAGVDGIDAVFIGPSDLAASLGHLSNPGHETVQAALAEAVQRLHRVGKPAGILAVTAQEARRYADYGFDFIAIGVDLGLMMTAARARLEEVQSGGA